MHEGKELLSLEKSTHGSSFQRSSKIYECDTNRVRYGPLSVVIPFLTALRAQPARIPLMFY